MHHHVHAICAFIQQGITRLQYHTQGGVVCGNLFISIILPLYTSSSSMYEDGWAVELKLLVILTDREERKGQ